MAETRPDMNGCGPLIPRHIQRPDAGNRDEQDPDHRGYQQ